MKTRNRLISAVLTLALLCPMLAFMLPLEADAALVPDDGVSSTSSSNLIYEEWNFDDLGDGASMSKGYINAHINGSFDASLFSGTWTAVTDNESGRKYVKTTDSYFKLYDPQLLLLNNPYEVSFDFMLASDSNNTDTSLLMWDNDITDDVRHAFLRYSPDDGNIGYYISSAESNKTSEIFVAPSVAPKGSWHNFRVRISPATGVIIVWIDGAYKFQYVNEYLKANAASAKNSALYIGYTWDSNRTTCLDNIKLTELKIDETLEFMPEIPAAVGGEWSFESATVENGAGITATLGSDSAHIGKKSGVGNDTGMYYIDADEGNVSGLHYAFGEPLYNFETVTLSYRTRYKSVTNWTNMFIFKNASNTEKVLLRVNAVPATSSASQLDWRDQSDKQTATDGTIKANIWYTFNLEVLPHRGLVNVTVTPDADSGETAWSFTATRTDIKDLCDSGNALSFYIYRQIGTQADMCIDDVKITTSRYTAKDISGSWNFDSKSLASADGLSAPVTSNMEYVADPSVKVAEGENATDYVLHTEYTSGKDNSPCGPDMTFEGWLKEYESITISFKIYYAAANNWTNVIRFKNASGAQKPLLRVESYSNGLGLAYRNGTTYINSKGETVDNQYGTYNGSTAAKLTKDAWNDISVTITPSTGDFTVSLNGTALRATSGGSTTFNNELIKELYDNNKSLSFQLYYHSKMQASTYFDDLEVEAKLVEVDTSAELKNRLNAEFVDPAFSVVNPDSTSRSYSEWKIAEDTSHIPTDINELIDFETLTVDTADTWLTADELSPLFGNGFSGFSSSLNYNSKDYWKVVADPISGGTRGNVISCVDKKVATFLINDKNKLAMSNKYEISFDILLTKDFTFTSETNLLWWSDNGTSNRKAILRYKMEDGNSDGVKDIKLGYRMYDGDTQSYGSGDVAYLTVGTNTWHNVKVVMDISLTGQNNTWVSVDGKEYYAFEQKYFPANYSTASASSVFGIHHSYTGAGDMGIYLDNISFKVDLDQSQYESNYVLQTNTDKSTASTLAIKDSQKYLARQPFEVSFDYCVNEVSGYINLMRLNMNGTWFSIWRVTNQYGVTHYTSTPYAKTVIPSSTSGYNLPPNVTPVSKLTQGQWYNVRAVINPLNGHIMCYWDNVLVSDYNINDVFIDESGASLDVCGANESKRDNVIIELAAAVGVSVVNSSFDNVRIRTLERHEYTKTCIGNADFDDLTAGSALTADSFMLTSGGIYTTAVNGSFTVEGSELGNYLAVGVVEGNSIDIGLTTDYNPLAAGVVAFEGNFNLKSFGTEGTLDLLSLVRDGGNTLPLLKVDTDGKLYMGTETNAVYTLKSGELYNVKLLMSGASGLLTLYINGKLVTAGVSMGITSAPNLTYKDDMNNTYVFNNQRFESYFAYGEDGAKRKTVSGLDLYEAATYDFTAIAWPNDTLKLLGATGAGTWQVIADDISLTRDEYADLYYNNYENISRLHGMSSSVYGSYVASMKYADETVDNVTNGYATMSNDKGGGRVGFWDNNSMLWGRDFVAQMDFRLNSIPDSLYYNLFTFVTGAAPDAITTWGSLLRIDSEGNLYKPEQEGGAYVSLGKQIPKEKWVNIAVAVSVNPWGNPTRSNNYMVRSVLVKVYVGREVVDTYVARVTSHLFDSLLRFCVESANNAIDIDVDNTRVYYGTSLRGNDAASDGSGIKFEGYNALTIDFEKESFFDEAQLNAIDYVDWRYSALGTTLTDLNDATVTISEKVTKDDNSFFRIRRPSFNNKPVAYMDYNLGTMGDYGEIYSIEMDIRYTDTLGHSMDVVELFERNLTGSLVLLSILGTNDDYSNTYYFENDGIRYYLCDKSGALLHVNPAGDGEFSEIGLVVNETEGYYSIWIDGQNAYYHADGGTSGEVVSAYKVPLEYEKQPSATVCDPVARLLRATDNRVTNSIIDVDNISIDVIKNGMAPVLYGEQVLNVGGAVRFVATVDTLYSNAVGFEVVANSNGAVSESGNTDKNSPVVYSSIWEESGKGLNKVTADKLGGRYIAVMTVTGIIDTAEYTFVITPYVYLFGEKVYGDAKTITYNHVKAGEAE